VSPNTGSSAVTDHGILTGLADDDHTQYHNDTRGDARYSLLAHTHLEADITDLDKYSVAAADAAFAPIVHTHLEADITDLDKYTQAAADAKFVEVAGDTMTGVLTVVSPRVEVQDVTPRLRLKETDAGVDGKNWDFRAAGGQLQFSLLNDALSGPVTAFALLRSGTSPTAAFWTVPQFNINAGTNARTSLILGEASVARGVNQDSRLEMWGEDAVGVLTRFRFDASGTNFGLTSSTVNSALQTQINIDMLAGKFLQIRDATSADWGRWTHDGTDFNLALTNTTDYNITGANVNIAADLLMAGTAMLDVVGGFTRLRDPSGSATLAMGASANFYDNDAHNFRTRSAGAIFSHDGTTFNVGGILVDLSGTLQIENTQPIYRWIETAAAANNRVWEIRANTEKLAWRLVDDALTGVTNFLEVDRTLNVADAATWITPSFIVNAKQNVASFLHIGEATTVRGTAQQANLRLWSEDGAGVITHCTILNSGSNLNITHQTGAIQFGSAVDVLNNSGLIVRDAANTDQGKWSHDGTDFNLVLTNTTDYNITGLTNLNVGGTPVSLSGHTHLEADITDLKAYLELAGGTMTGDLKVIHTGAQIEVRADGVASSGGTALYTGSVAANGASGVDLFRARIMSATNNPGFSISVQETQNAVVFGAIGSAGTRKYVWAVDAAQILFLNPGSLELFSGIDLVVRDTTNVDSGDWSHDGTDFNLVLTNTTDYNITGLTNLNVGGTPVSLSGHTHLEADITDLQAYLLNITGEPFSDHSDVTITAITSGELPKWNGSAWINNTLAEAGISATGHTHLEANITDLDKYTQAAADAKFVEVAGDTMSGNLVVTGSVQTGNFGAQGTTPITKPTITGARGGISALASLLNALASYGLVIDNSSF